ncbi:unnamed protein product [Phaeothamnion confervicola]
MHTTVTHITYCCRSRYQYLNCLLPPPLPAAAASAVCHSRRRLLLPLPPSSPPWPSPIAAAAADAPGGFRRDSVGVAGASDAQRAAAVPALQPGDWAACWPQLERQHPAGQVLSGHPRLLSNGGRGHHPHRGGQRRHRGESRLGLTSIGVPGSSCPTGAWNREGGDMFLCRQNLKGITWRRLSVTIVCSRLSLVSWWISPPSPHTRLSHSLRSVMFSVFGSWELILAHPVGMNLEVTTT